MFFRTVEASGQRGPQRPQKPCPPPHPGGTAVEGGVCLVLTESPGDRIVPVSCLEARLTCSVFSLAP